jgi:ectoine hydroxylase-related dioxygenase (phytanoyl-CoA dioxygenase family)
MKKNITKEDVEFYDLNGYIIFNINDDALIDKVNNDVNNYIKEGDFKTNSKMYSYNDSPRIVESWKVLDSCKRLSLSPIVISWLEVLSASSPKAFSTINFLHSTQQPLHSDYVHFGTLPEGKLAGSWIALEDIDPLSGPLQVVPGSHKLDYFNYEMVSDSPPKKLDEIKRNYELYEKWVLALLEKRNLKAVTPQMKKGDCIIWDANLLHGSPDCQDNKILRRSQVTHWTFDGVKKHYNPVFSQRTKGKFIERKVVIFN